jgi:hypothetical protein
MSFSDFWNYFWLMRVGAAGSGQRCFLGAAEVQ